MKFNEAGFLSKRCHYDFFYYGFRHLWIYLSFFFYTCTYFLLHVYRIIISREILKFFLEEIYLFMFLQTVNEIFNVYEIKETTR